jgi:CDP-paratose 2-epimerase
MNSNGRFRSAVIFGGAGFIGSNWAHWLLHNSSAKVHIFDNLSRPGVRHNLDWLQQSAPASGRLTITVADVRNNRMVESAVRHATEIYHFAAQVAVTTSVADPRYDFEVNVGGTLNILEAARKFGRRPFILFTSTNKVYGKISDSTICEQGRYRLVDETGISESQPLDFYSPYGCSKGAADQYVHDYSRIYDLPTVVFRMSCIAGPRQFGTEDQGWVAHFLYSALQARPIVIHGDGRQVRDVLCIDDLLRAGKQLPGIRAGVQHRRRSVECRLFAGTDREDQVAHRSEDRVHHRTPASRRPVGLRNQSREAHADDRVASTFHRAPKPTASL